GEAGADRSTRGGKNSVTSGAAVPTTCRPASVRRGPWMSRSPHALPAPEYRLAPRVGSIPTPRVVMPAGLPWRQGMLCRDGIASVKFSLPEQLPTRDLQHRPRRTVHQSSLHRAAETRRRPDEYGWPWPGAGQRVCGAAVADCQVRGGVSTGVQHGARGPARITALLWVLSRRASPSGVGVSHARSRIPRLRGTLLMKTVWKELKHVRDHRPTRT